MKKYKIFSLILFICLALTSTSFSTISVKASELSNNIDEQLENIDFSELENLINSLEDVPSDFDLMGSIKSMLKGEYSNNYDNILSYIKSLLFNSVREILPIIVSILSIAILSGIFNNIKSNFASQGISDIIFFVCFLGVILVLGGQIFAFYKNTKNLIENISKLNSIMSPIILTLMVASGGTVSATVYKPAVTFLSSGIINIFLSVVLPLILLSSIFLLVSSFLTTVKLNKLSDCINSVIKWIIGLSVTIFGLFLSVQGLTSACFDGISIRATKFAISNTIPIIGGFIKDGFDLVVAGSILIKNSIGVTCVFVLLFQILSPVLFMAVFSLLLKFLSGIIEPFCDNRISLVCECASKIISYFIASILMVGVMIFITILLMIFSANTFI